MVFVNFLQLQLLHNGCMFSMLLLPPFESGMIWSMDSFIYGFLTPFLAIWGIEPGGCLNPFFINRIIPLSKNKINLFHILIILIIL